MSDAQIDQYLEPQRYPDSTAAQTTSPDENTARQTVQSLRLYFTPPEDVTRSVQRVWQRLERRQAELEAQSIEHLTPQITDLSQIREKRTQVPLPVTKPGIARSHQRFSPLSTLIAVACILFVVGGAVFVLQRLRTETDQLAASQTSHVAVAESAGSGA